MNSVEIRKKYLEFFKEKGHQIIPSSSLVPENDPTTLFTGSGMQPMVPYLLGQKHPQGDRIADSQKCFRSGDIEDIGDNRHTTFFEMLGNWSLGAYFKKEQIEWMFEFLTKEIGLDPNKLFVSAFIGDSKNGVLKDIEASLIWKNLFEKVGVSAKEVDIGSEENGYNVGMQEGRIFYYDAKKNWWSRAGVPENMPEGEPGGPDSEMFYQIDDIEHDSRFGKHCHINCDCGRYIEIGNNVFMQFVKTKNGFETLPQKNIDFGGGLERLVLVSENKSDIFKTDFFQKALDQLEKLSSKSYDDPKYTKYFRVILDHLRASIFLIADGVIPANTDRNYFVRRLLRRAVMYFDKLEIADTKLSVLVPSFLEVYKDAYPDTYQKQTQIEQEIDKEEEKFRKTLKEGLKKFEKGEKPFILFTTYGFPFELTKELAKEKGIKIDEDQFKEEMKKHQELSRLGSEQKFKGGLGDSSEMSVRYHTATHLLHKALRDVLGEKVSQKGSNITPERLRFDFSFDRKITDDEKSKIEEIVNEKIKEAIPVQNVIMKKDEAEKSGALHFFGEKYADEVSVYFIGENLENAYSKEFCGGPHIKNTKELGTFKIIKEEAVSSGVRRIKATLI